jgi:hypothetical protein
VRSILRAVWLAVTVMTIVAASAAVSIARTPGEESAGAAPATALVVPDALVHRVGGAFTGIPDEAAMVLVGAALFGVAAAVKRAG